MDDLDLIEYVNRTVAELEKQVAPAIAEGIRVASNTPANATQTVAESAGISLQFGTVVGFFPAQGFANVLLDGQSTATAVTVLGATNVGDRVGVLFYPPSGTLMLGTVNPTTGGGGGSSSALDWFNVKTYGALGNGITVDTNPVQTAANACAANGGGILYFPFGVYPCQFICASNVQILGEGPGASVLLLPDNATGLAGAGSLDDEAGVPLLLEDGVTVLELEMPSPSGGGSSSGPPLSQEDGVNSIFLENGLDLQLESGSSSGPVGSAPRVIESEGFGGLTGSNSTGGPVEFSIRGVTVDGNKTNNVTSDGVVLYGSDFRLDNVRVRDCAGVGIYSEWSTAAGRADAAVWTDVKVHDCTGDGIQTVGGAYAKYGVYTFANADADSGP